MAEEKVDVLEQHIENLEKRVFGDADKDAAYPKDAPQIVDTLASLKQQLTSAISGRQKIVPVMKNLGELNDNLDPSYTDTLTLGLEAKAEIILAEEDYIRRTSENLEKVKDMADVLGSEHIKVVPALEEKLQQLSKLQLQQQDKSCESSEEVKHLLSQYNSAVTSISKQFIHWDELVTKLEVANQPKEQLD